MGLNQGLKSVIDYVNSDTIMTKDKKKGLFQVTWSENIGSVGFIYFLTFFLYASPSTCPKIDQKSVKM